MTDAPRVVALHDGRAGVRAQAEGLAGAVAARIGAELDVRTDAPDVAPTLAVGCGSKSRAILRSLRKRGTKTVYVQDPRRRYSVYDLVVAPEHDAVDRPNAVSMIGSPTRYPPAALDAVRADPLPAPDGFPDKRAAMLIGGTSSRFEMDAEAQAMHLAAARRLLEAGFGLMVTTSRRTPGAARAAWAKLGERPDVWLHTGGAPNPYPTFLATADLLCVTEDSTNMLSEACGTGQPVFRLPMSGKPGKFAQLYDALAARCHVRRWDGDPSAQGYAPLDETNRVADIVVERLALAAR